MNTPVLAAGMPSSTDSLLQAFREAGEALPRLVLPPMGSKDVFDLISTAGLREGTFLQTLGVSEKDFVSAEEYNRAQQRHHAWKALALSDDPSLNQGRKAAFSLQALLGHLGEPDTQAQALEAYERFFPCMALSLNSYASDGSIDTYLEEHAQWRMAHPVLKDCPLFQNEGPEQEDRYALYGRGVWTVTSYERTPKGVNSVLIAVASSPDKVLAKAWRDAPHLERYRRMEALVDALPVPTPTRKPRF